jgi:hypothetical protein
MARDEVVQRLKQIEHQLSQTREFHERDMSVGYWETISHLDRALNELLDLKIQLVDELREAYRS